MPFIQNALDGSASPFRIYGVRDFFIFIFIWTAVA
jgi:hypothetical protein